MFFCKSCASTFCRSRIPTDGSFTLYVARNEVWQLESLQTEQLPVKITVNTMIHNGSEKETYELITFGHYYKKTKSVFLRYEEFVEEGTINTVVKISDQEGSIIRSGAVKMRI